MADDLPTNDVLVAILEMLKEQPLYLYSTWLADSNCGDDSEGTCPE